MKLSGYHFHVNLNIWRDSQICISVPLNNNNDPDENIFNNLSQIDLVFHTVEKAATSSKKFNDKTFSLLHLNVRSLSQNFESLKELLTTIKFEFKVISALQKYGVRMIQEMKH